VESAYFKDKVALVTGSSRGIGAAIARKFARAGANVALNYRKEGGTSEKKALELREEIEKMGRKSVALRADVSKKAEVKALVAGTLEALGGVDFLILNAARSPFKPIERLLERELRQLVETNYMGNIFCIQEALSALTESKGQIIFISSLGSKFYNPSYPLGSMKAAMEAVVRDCAESLRPRGIRVNGVCGGIVRTDALKTLRQFWEELDQIPEEVFIEPDEMADAVLFLCSPGARGILGQTIVLDKGMSLSLFRSPGKK
jgi:NAD(P)-dependent dehydrogenase (short-subunit alcohol dehydrogenase family)